LTSQFRQVGGKPDGRKTGGNSRTQLERRAWPHFRGRAQDFARLVLHTAPVPLSTELQPFLYLFFEISHDNLRHKLWMISRYRDKQLLCLPPHSYQTLSTVPAAFSISEFTTAPAKMEMPKKKNQSIKTTTAPIDP